ncbi:PP2C family serine/threonine-protein phosphatase [Succinimonas amylolytica]|uniref:PP2C family serine/threonine-protein phosphatase n=1 Tax=Succinimonas amylolytica TaxID=83769 RepID=UPI001B7FB55C|nr:PP2C family serine/threonine-protein phosphatase [Succinimonas amylolytica]
MTASDEDPAVDAMLAVKPAKFPTENIAVSSVNHISSTPESIASVQTLQKNKTDADSASSRPKPAPKPKVNPRALWNNKPTPADISFPKPDSYNIGFEVPDEGLKIFGASQRGRSHAHVGSPRDDDFSILRTDNEGWNILIVADGAGSAKFSREGSKVACESISRDLNLKLSDSQDPLNLGIQQFCSDKSRPEINDLKEIKKLAYYQIVPVVKAAISSIEAVMNNCREEPVTLKDFATTLLMAVTKKIGSYYLVISFAIGDGAIVVYDEHESPVSSRIVKDGKTPYNDRSLLMNTPDSGEFAGQTRFLTMKNLFTNANELINRISVHVVSSFTAIMLMSDGVSDAKFETEYLMSDKSNWDAFWKDLTVTGGDDSPPIRLSSEPLELSKQLLEWLNYWVVGNHDDRTIVVMYKYE